MRGVRGEDKDDDYKRTRNDVFNENLYRFNYYELDNHDIDESAIAEYKDELRELQMEDEMYLKEISKRMVSDMLLTLAKAHNKNRLITDVIFCKLESPDITLSKMGKVLRTTARKIRIAIDEAEDIFGKGFLDAYFKCASSKSSLSKINYYKELKERE
jgi:hypothetical protein